MEAAVGATEGGIYLTTGGLLPVYRVGDRYNVADAVSANQSGRLEDDPALTTGHGGPGPSAITAGEAVVFAAFTSACICATIIGNILVILSVFTYRPLRNVANFFIVSLAVADLAVAILVMPFNVANFIIGHWVFGEVFCNMWLTFDVLTCTASILNLCAVAVDRYYAIHDPINYAQKRTIVRVLVSIAIVWLASAIISVPPIFGWNNSSGDIGLFDKSTSSCQLTDARSYVIYSAAGSFYIPLFIMTFVYVNVFRAVRRRLRERADAATAAKLAAAVGKGGQRGIDSTETAQNVNEHSSSDTPDDPGGTAAGADNNGACLPLERPDSVDSGSSKSTKKLLGDSSVNDTGCRGQENSGGLRAGGGGSERRPSPSPVTDRLNPPPTSHNNKPSHSTGQVQQFLEEKQRISLSKERRAARTMAIIMGVFVLCWLPFFLMYVIFPFCAACAQTDPRVINFIVWLGYINSSLNPVIYTIFNIDFRRAFKKLLQGKWRGN